MTLTACKQVNLSYCIGKTYDEAISEVDRQVDLIDCEEPIILIKCAPFGSQNSESPNRTVFWLTQSPEETIFRAFVISATGARVCDIPAALSKLSVLKPLPQFWFAIRQVALGYRVFLSKLSDSPLNTPLLVNRQVAFGAAKHIAIYSFLS